MLYILVALFLFLDAVLIHILVCRQAKQEGLLLKLFFVIAGVNLVICWLVFGFLSGRLSHSGFFFSPLVWSATIIYILLIPSYLVFYFSTQQVSPSKKIMLLLCERDLSFEELQKSFKDQEWIQPRISDLLMTKCIVESGGRYTLTFSGQQMARVYALYQAVLGRTKGG